MYAYVSSNMSGRRYGPTIGNCCTNCDFLRLYRAKQLGLRNRIELELLQICTGRPQTYSLGYKTAMLSIPTENGYRTRYSQPASKNRPRIKTKILSNQLEWPNDISMRLSTHFEYS